ncbi:solute carrier family 35 member E3 [Sodiomyces alkalinus F11]|uniref:Solute carrier family 35 member E3 n=1 Tax=Sodiomyces alkalinus (strain CBS 110278 / VKM F-3762 / F11) TaxID=1314773 RepID=A0A3N2PN38_SODAK|nr:solute carrier family 35 member E3 [Sodiomyces alkalinus F11]ROT35913.1 solute carrier family 35 member E3 [Sodiomyces alkalinus F11]
MSDDQQQQQPTLSRVPSFASSATATGSLEERDNLLKSDPLEDELDDDFPQLKRACDLEARRDDGDEEANEHTRLLPRRTEQSETPKSNFKSALIWMVVNTIATVGIVFANKAIFSDPGLKFLQLSFATFHFFITWLTLHILSRPRFAFFTPRSASIKDLIPLSVAMCLNVVLPNFSLAFSSVTFYQIARILLTPTVALMNFVLYGATMPLAAVLSLVPACAGVGIVSYYDSRPTDDSGIKTTSMLGVIFAFAGIFASSLYTVWIGSYHRKLKMSSMQLLYNQAPVSAFMLLYLVPFIDRFPVWTEVPLPRWILILISGLCASVLNISQFFIVAQAGPVSSTVVGHVKTCAIVALGWMVSGRAIHDKSILGVLIAISGIIIYSAVMLQHKRKERQQLQQK